MSPWKSVVNRSPNVCSNAVSTASDVEKYRKSSMNRPRVRGGSPGMIVPVKMHGAFGIGWRPMSARACLQVWYQCRGDRLRPYKVRLSKRYVSDGVMGHPWGGFADVLLIFWQEGLDKCLCYVSCFWDSSHLNGDGDEDAEFERGEDWSEAACWGPIVRIEIS